MRPCDCKDRNDATRKLKEQGLKFNDKGILVNPNYVLLENGCCTMKFSMKHFKAFAEWYLEDQD